MAEGRRGLGRGLAALLDEAETAPTMSTAPFAEELEIPIENLRPNPGQPRQSFPADELADLATSIGQRGVVQPILVRPTGGGAHVFQIVAGERRWRAAQQAGLKTVPVIVRSLTDDAALEFALIENIQRSDLNALEEARGYADLGQRFGRSQEAIAGAVGKSRSHVANTLRLLRLPKSVQDQLSAGRLTAGHARALLDLAQAEAVANHVIDRGLNVRQTEAFARKLRKGGSDAGTLAAGARKKDADTRDLEANLSDALGLKVDIRDVGGAGEVRVRYENLEQLDDICRRLSRSA